MPNRSNDENIWMTSVRIKFYWRRQSAQQTASPPITGVPADTSRCAGKPTLPPGFAPEQFAVQSFHEVIVSPTGVGIQRRAGTIRANLTVAQNAAARIVGIQIFVATKGAQHGVLGFGDFGVRRA